MGLKLITPPAAYPVSLAEAKAHLRVDFSDDDALIEVCLKAATENAEEFTGRAFIDQIWDYYLDSFPSGEIKIPKPPLIEVLGVFNLNSAGTEQEFAQSGYRTDTASELARITLAYGGSWPTPQAVSNAVRIRLRAGYLTDDSPQTENVPFAIKAGILITIGDLYANRESIVVGTITATIPIVQQLLRPYRVHTAMA